ETTVDIRHGKQLSRIGGLHAAAIQNSYSARHFGALGPQLRADRGMHFLSLLRGGRQAGANCPDRLVSHDRAIEGAHTQLLDDATQLALHDLQGLARLTLSQRLTDTQDRYQPARLGRRELAAQHRLAFAENLASLGMPDQHIRTTRISQLTRGDLAGQRALHRLHRAVLRTQANRLALEPHHHLGDIQSWRHYCAVTEDQASHGMPYQHIRTTRISQLTRGDLAGQRALHRLHRAVLRTHANRLALEPHHHLGDIQRGRNYSNLDSHRQSQLTKTSDQFSYAGAGTVHLPVTSYQWSTHALPRRSKWAQMLPKSFNTGKRIKHIDSL